MPFPRLHVTLPSVRELLQSNDLALLSAVKAALTAEGIAHVEFDDQLASLYGGVFARRIMVDDDDLRLARNVVRAISPEHVAEDPRP